MKKTTSLFGCLPLLLSGASATADEIPLLHQEIHLVPGETRAFEFGTVPQENTTILLEVAARMDSPGLAGSMYFLKLTLNGREVKAAVSRTATRLLNRPLVSPVTPDLSAPWFGIGGWRVLYAPNFESARKQPFYVGDPHTLVLDVTDLVNPAAENRLEITNTATASLLQRSGIPGHLVIRTLTIRTRPGQSPLMAGAAAIQPVINTGQPAAGPAKYRGEVLPGGGFVITIGKRRYAFTSAFSYPNVGLNHLVPAAQPDRSGQPGWKVRVHSTRSSGAVVAEGPDYRLVRTLRFTPGKIDVSDAITNAHTNAPLGLLVRHEMSLSDLPSPVVRLAGNPDPGVSDYYSPHNPSVHVTAGNHSIGLLCEDDVFRNQARLFCTMDTNPPVAGLRTEMLRLAPGETYTLRWSVYPIASADYYDFINAVRRDWGANHTVEGAWTFFHPDSILQTPVEELRRHFERLGIRYAASWGGWVDPKDPKRDHKRIGFGTGVLDDYWADYRRRLREATERLHQAGVKVLIYYDTQRDTSEGGPERFRDSWLTDAQGRHLSTEWGGQYSLTWSMVATLENSFGQAMLAAVDRYFDELGADGLYWDEMEITGYGFPLLTYNLPDGHSCLLDPKTYTIQREVGLTTLLGEKHRLAVIDRVRRRGGFLLGNGPNCTRALLRAGVQRMVEIQHNDYWCYEGDLGTPLGYASSRVDFGNVTRALRMARLLVGTRYTYEHEISRYLFPFTPIELHHGYLLGQERIVTLHSGRYGWPGERCLVQVHHFNRQGKHTDVDYPTTIGREARTEVALGEEEVVVLERLPVACEPHRGSAEVRQVRYSPQGLSLQIRTSQGATLRLADGIFPVKSGRRYQIQVGSARQTLVATDKGIALEVPPSTQDVAVAAAGDNG